MNNASRTLVGGLALGAAVAAPAHAEGRAVIEVELPALPVAEYHKPYVATWIEGADGAAVATLTVWYDVKKRNNAGAQWLQDMRTWWRKAGRDMTMPADGVSAPTRAPGRQTHALPAAATPFAKLPEGDYRFVVEASREAGGREVVKAPFKWKPGGAVDVSVNGESELGKVRLVVKS